jgi:site-specific recombinase XerD
MKAALLSIALIAAAISTTAAAEPIKVFVFTNEVPSGSVDEQLQARRESLQDLAKALAGPKYRSTLSVVKSRDEADVIVELVSRGETTKSGSSNSTHAAGGAASSESRSSSVTKQFLKFRMSAGQHTDNLTTEDQLRWPDMAERAADDLARWIVANAVRP